MSIPKDVMDADSQQRGPMSLGLTCVKRSLPTLSETPSPTPSSPNESSEIEQKGMDEQHDDPTRARTLTQREEAFCLAVVEGLRPSDAYRKVYKPQKAKAKTINEKASRLMSKGKVRARVEALLKPLVQRAQLRREQWLERIARMMLFDVRKMFDTQGNPLPITELGENEAAALLGFECYENFEGKGEARRVVGHTKKFRLADRIRAFELYGKAMGYYADKMEVAGKDGAPISRNVEFVDPA
ncbi:MAG: hypothetical protein OJF52_003713 [Nitrospira sp.]|jgi:phage terminase small subunit|nr:MAG: hypothetical protein OJF52_003713 [Nitrospira sp.]